MSIVVLAALFGLVVVSRYRSELHEATDARLDARFDEAAATVRTLRDPLDRRAVHRSLPASETLVQVTDRRGTVLASRPRALRDTPVLDASERARASRGRVFLERSALARHGPIRFLAGPVRAGGTTVVIAVGTLVEGSEQAARRLELALAVGLTVLAGLVVLGGWLLSGAVLAPVRALIEEADDLSLREPGRRLAGPAGGEEIVELTRRLNAMLDRLESSAAHERAFLDDASHELRTPIAILRGEVELARLDTRSTPDGGELAARLDSVLEEVQRLDDLAANLLVLARSRAPRPVERRPVDLSRVADRVVDALARSRPAPGGPTVTVDGSAVVDGDEAALERVLRNAVDNAFRHAGGRVAVGIAVVGDRAVVTVVDDGPGFPPALVGQRFDRFARPAPAAGGAGPPSGAGLGLAIADAIVAAHGGRMTATNPAAGGAELRIELPARASGA